MDDAVTTIGERLREAIEGAPTGKNFDEKVEALNEYARGQGVRGVHSTRKTLRRWLEGRGRPPNYWLRIAAEHLGVAAYWLLTGEGVKAAPEGAPAPLPPEEKKPEPPAEKPKAEAKPRKRRAAKPKETPPADGQGGAEESIPSPADVYATAATTIGKYIKSSSSVAAIKAILEHEPRNPNKEGGRITVLKAAKKKLAELEG